MVPLARRNLLAEKVRFSMSIAGVAFAVLLVLVIASLYRGWSKSSAFFGELPGQIWVGQQGTSDPLRSSSHLPEDGLDTLGRIEGVALVMPVYSRRIAVPAQGAEFSVQFMSFVVPPTVPISDGDRRRFFPSSGSIIIDRAFADKANVSVGAPVHVLDSSLSVEHITPDGNPLFELAFVNGTDAPHLLGLQGYVSFFVLVLKPGASTDAVTKSVAATLPGAEARTSAQYAKAMSDTVDQGFLPVVGALVAIGLIIGGAVVGLTTYTATIEKARDFAVLKALGASAWFVYRIVIRQSALVGTLGSTIGVISAAFVATLVQRVVPEFITDMRWPDAVGVFATTIVVSLVAAYIPVRRINRIDPAMVFRA